VTVTDAVDTTPIPREITTASRVNPGIAILEFTDWHPTAETEERLLNHLDYLHGLEVFMKSIQAVSTYALHERFAAAGIKDGDIVIGPELMDSRSRFLTGKADAVYFLGFLDLSNGPLVLETPSHTLGVVDDMWSRRIPDSGLPSANPGRGGHYVLLPPDYEGTLPEDGYLLRHSSTNRVLLLGRAFVDQYEDNQPPTPTANWIQEELKIYPFAAGGIGGSLGARLTAAGTLEQPMVHRDPRVVEGTALATNQHQVRESEGYDVHPVLLVAGRPRGGWRSPGGGPVGSRRKRVPMMSEDSHLWLIR
jgi:hypothetical protein